MGGGGGGAGAGAAVMAGRERLFRGGEAAVLGGDTCGSRQARRGVQERGKAANAEGGSGAGVRTDHVGT